MSRAYYKASIEAFLQAEESSILGELTQAHGQELQHSQTIAWAQQIRLLKQVLVNIDCNGNVFFEFMIPRMGRRADVLVILGGVIFVLEFKVGATTYSYADRAQTAGYALDLKHFHAGSHNKYLVPVLICTHAQEQIAYSDLCEHPYW
jgi:hypothetical protein